VDIGCPFVFVSFKTDCNTQSFIYFYSIHPVVIYKNKKSSSSLQKRSGYRNIIWLFFTNGMKAAFYDIIRKIEQNAEMMGLI
ncbi:TPA: hypothetical protein ACF42C_000561, partial [Streptococcus pyogenes]